MSQIRKIRPKRVLENHEQYTDRKLSSETTDINKADEYSTN